MTLMEQCLKDKAEARKKLAALPFEEKLKILERLRDFALYMREWRKTNRPGKNL
jgi:hypothetical protein